MRKIIRIFQRARDWLERDAIAPLLAGPLELPRYEDYANARAVVLAIDVSPSMDDTDYHPTRLEGAKRAVRRYLSTLRLQEQPTLVGLVDFHGEAELVSPPLPVADRYEELVQALTRLHSGAGTNIGGGLELARKELARAQAPTNPTVILLTDGASNYGPDPIRVADTIKEHGIQLDIIGIGGSPPDVNEADLKRMASRINGQLRYWFIESADAFVERFEALALREIQ